jgi:phthiodiolone/phenolphthiodiolone dimycocerosates ketoreductase
MTKHAPILGIGAGGRVNIDPYGLDFSHPVGRLEEALQIIRMCFSQPGRLDFKGDRYTLDGALMELKAPPGRTPVVWFAGHGPRMLELTATYGDGWYPTMLATPQEYAAKLEAIRTSARAAGRNPQDILPALHRFLVVAATERDAKAQLGHKAIRALGLGRRRSNGRGLGQHPFGPGFRGYVDLVADRYDRRTIDEAIAAVPAELVENGPLLWGSPEQVADKLRAFGEAGLRHVVLAPVSGLVSKSAATYSLWAMRSIARSLAHAR